MKFFWNFEQNILELRTKTNSGVGFEPVIRPCVVFESQNRKGFSEPVDYVDQDVGAYVDPPLPPKLIPERLAHIRFVGEEEEALF